MDGLKEGSRIAVGSLPTLDPIAAVRTQLLAFPEIPAWPQLPHKSAREKMGLQGLSGFSGLHWVTQTKPVWNVPPGERARLLEQLANDNRENRLDQAAFQPEEASGFFSFLSEASKLYGNKMAAVKGQLAGPITLGSLLKDELERPLLASKDSMNVLKAYLLMHARWQAKELSKLGKPVVLFLDEPVLGVNFKPADYGLEWDEIKEWISELLLALQEEEVVTGLHCCGPQPWNWIFETPAEMIHVDSFQYMDQIPGKAQNLQNYIHRGGLIVWGMVPTAMAKGAFPEPVELLHRLEDLFETLGQMGVNKEELIRRSYFSTSCGLGNSSVSVAEEAVRCLGNLVSLWKATVL
jgi:methionine synthase II (cobalamin-independent)